MTKQGSRGGSLHNEEMIFNSTSVDVDRAEYCGQRKNKYMLPDVKWC